MKFVRKRRPFTASQSVTRVMEERDRDGGKEAVDAEQVPAPSTEPAREPG